MYRCAEYRLSNSDSLIRVEHSHNIHRSETEKNAIDSSIKANRLHGLHFALWRLALMQDSQRHFSLFHDDECCGNVRKFFESYLFNENYSWMLLKNHFLSHVNMHSTQSGLLFYNFCLSVRPSRWWIVSRRLKISSHFFLGRHSSFFWRHAQIPNSKGNPFSGAQNTRGGKNLRFRRKSPSISGTVRDKPMVAMEC